MSEHETPASTECAPPANQRAAALGRPASSALLGATAAALLIWASPPVALVSGILFALVLGHPFPRWNRHVSKWLLQACVVLLGFGTDLPTLLHLGMNGALFAAATISATLALGWWLGRRLALDRNTSALISVGTAVCGGSAIAAVSSVIAASEAEIALALGTVFLLNAVALCLFPVAGHLLHLSQPQFGLWAGVAIHDISSVVGAGVSYGAEALQTATAVKLSRTLWIVPLSLAFALRWKRRQHNDSTKKARVTIPWFIGLFLLASLLRSFVPAIAEHAPELSAIAKRGTILVLFLIGTALSAKALRVVGWRAVAAGAALWLFISLASLAAIVGLHLS